MSVPALGRRGGGWVVLQFAVMALLAVSTLVPPRWPDGVQTALIVAGALLALAGAALAVWSARVLGRGLTPFPRPSAAGALVERGPYGVVRHPIYTAGLLFCGGVSLATSVPALVLTGVLGLVWALKLRVEERFLRARFPGYGAYCRRVRRRLVPFVY